MLFEVATKTPSESILISYAGVSTGGLFILRLVVKDVAETINFVRKVYCEVKKCVIE